ncbi:4-oxalocrotonate tautomerase family protein [Rhodoferax sp.]|uniref:tautomerase family protein n=1 Tax=Rhodoferax sp. TaxID=50421 RepID=UPI002637FB24|nr:4-oxalocrotonate tautomerase family protein [Rhodoferax sp.]MDD2925204.1 4-oxalocrotonate tautomerase family protein [Rhodoferax sp.]
MPIVIIKMLQREHTTDAQKEQVIAGVTRLMTEVLGKKPESTQVVIEEVPLQNWGSGGQSIAARDRARLPSA